MFVNLSNHPSGKWTAEQINAASRLYGEVRDLPFPAVPTLATPDDVAVMADEYVARAFAMREDSMTSRLKMMSRRTLNGKTVRRELSSRPQEMRRASTDLRYLWTKR